MQILDGMLNAEFAYLISKEPIMEYTAVLHRPSIVSLHQLTTAESGTILSDIVMNSICRVPMTVEEAPDPNDNHLWRLLSSEPKRILVTGDRVLQNNSSLTHPVISPKGFIDLLLSKK